MKHTRREVCVGIKRIPFTNVYPFQFYKNTYPLRDYLAIQKPQIKIIKSDYTITFDKYYNKIHVDILVLLLVLEILVAPTVVYLKI